MYELFPSKLPSLPISSPLHPSRGRSSGPLELQTHQKSPNQSNPGTTSPLPLLQALLCPRHRLYCPPFLISADYYFEWRSILHQQPVCVLLISIHPGYQFTLPEVLITNSLIFTCPLITILWWDTPEELPWKALEFPEELNLTLNHENLEQFSRDIQNFLQEVHRPISGVLELGLKYNSNIRGLPNLEISPVLLSISWLGVTMSVIFHPWNTSSSQYGLKGTLSIHSQMPL